MRQRCEDLLLRAQAALERGEFKEGYRLAIDAEALAREAGDQDLADRAFCNACAFAIELDTASGMVPRLKQILLGSGNSRNRFLAAYYTAVAYDLDDDLTKASSYARRAAELAAELPEPELRARSANLAGNLALREAEFEAAESCYEQAMAAHRGRDGYHRLMEAQEKDNLGYVLLCTDRISDGLSLCEEARETLDAMGDVHYLPQTLQDLCYGYLLNDNLDLAQRHGERALDLAAAAPDPLVVKNCLFLLSEVAVRRGDSFRARRYLRELTTHYPEVGISEEIIDVFLATDLTTVVNLRG
jgi:tetratricopeptide (TPR) repeat protein